MTSKSPYELFITDRAQGNLEAIDKKVSVRIIKKMKWVAANVHNVQHYALQGEEWKGYFRWRIGDYRAIYSLDHEGRLVILAVVGHRSKVYEGEDK